MKDIHARMSLSILAIALATSCDRGPTSPSVPAPPSEPVVTRVELIAPASLAPGASVQLRLIAHFANGSTQDVTSAATFSSRSSSSVLLAPSGAAVGQHLGEEMVTGSYRTVSISREIVVVPDGTYRVIGQVFQESESVPIDGVRVEGDGARPTQTDFDGHYRLYGVTGNGRLRLSKPGYVTKELILSISDHHTEDLRLSIAGPRIDVTGLYEMTIDASAQCRDRIPDPLLTRRYTAAITQIGADLRIKLSGASFGSFYGPPSPETANLPGWVEQGQVHLLFEWPTHCEWGGPNSQIVEAIDATTYLEIAGDGTLAATNQGFAGTLRGHFAVRPDSRCGSSASAWCGSTSYRVTLTR